jgi:hypothetical protein
VIIGFDTLENRLVPNLFGVGQTYLLPAPLAEMADVALLGDDHAAFTPL